MVCGSFVVLFSFGLFGYIFLCLIHKLQVENETRKWKNQLIINGTVWVLRHFCHKSIPKLVENGSLIKYKKIQTK